MKPSPHWANTFQRTQRSNSTSSLLTESLHLLSHVEHRLSPCCGNFRPHLSLMLRRVSKALRPVNGSPVRPGWSSLHRLLRPRCPGPDICDLPTYPEGSPFRFRRCSQSNFPADLGLLPIP